MNHAPNEAATTGKTTAAAMRLGGLPLILATMAGLLVGLLAASIAHLLAAGPSA
jgi:hypothetical protein